MTTKTVIANGALTRGSRSPWPPEKEAECLRLRAMGWSGELIADVIGSKPGLVRGWLRKRGVRKPTLKQAIEELLKLDPSASTAEIARQVRCSKDYVCEVRQALGMALPSPAGEASSNGKPVHGPFVTDGRINMDGQAFLTEWLSQCRNPVALFRSQFPGLYKTASTYGIPEDELRTLCISAAAFAILHFHPSSGRDFNWRALYKMQRAVSDRIDELTKPRDYGVTFVKGGQAEDGGVLNMVGEFNEGFASVDDRDASLYLNNRIKDILCQNEPEPNKRELFSRYFGLVADEKPTLVGVAKAFNMSKTKAMAILDQVLIRIKPHLEELYLDHCWEGAA